MARVFVALAVVATGCLATSAARADDQPHRGLEAALRAGIAFPGGQTVQHSDVSSAISYAVPLTVEVGYRLDPTVFVAGRFEYAFESVKNTIEGCADSLSCNGFHLSLGAEGIYRFRPFARLVPWGGLGVGYEWFQLHTATVTAIQNSSTTATAGGLQGQVQCGVDVRVSRTMTVGPYLEVQFGRYERASITQSQDNTTASNGAAIENPTWHEWLEIGVRGSFGF